MNIANSNIYNKITTFIKTETVAKLATKYGFNQAEALEFLSGEKNHTTQQMQNEEKQKHWFANNSERLFGLRVIKEWDSSENKNKNSDADQTCEVIANQIHPALDGYKVGDVLTISLKTKGGNIAALANLGTSSNARIFQDHIILTDTEREQLLSCNEAVKKIKTNCLRADWCNDLKGEKNKIKELYTQYWLNLLETPGRIEALYRFVNDRTSPLKLVGEELIECPRYIKSNEVVTPFIVGDDSVSVGHFKLRFKAESRPVNSGWKINVTKN